MDENDASDLLSSFETSNEYSILDSSDETDVIQKTVNNIFEHRVRNHASYKACENIAAIINETSKIAVPKSKYLLKAAAEYHFKRFYYVFCSGCNELVLLDKKCPNCQRITKKTKDNYYIYIPIEQQINYFLKKYLNEILDYIELTKENRNFMYDIHSASVYKSLNSNKCSEEDIILSLTICTDGAQMYRSSKGTFYPIFVKLNFLPPNIRFKRENILIVGLYYGKQKPDIDKIIFPLAEEIQKLTKSKIRVLYNGSLLEFIPIVMFCTCDLVARPMVMRMNGHSAYFGCPLCLHNGNIIMGVKKKYVRYVKQNVISEMRTHKNFLKTAKSVQNTNIKINGINGITSMLYFENFNVVDGFNTDYMHGAFLGVMKHMLDIWLKKKKLKNGISYISAKNCVILDNRIVALKPFSRIKRRPRSILERSFYKATEYKHLLLFYLTFALQGLIEIKYIKNFEKFSAGIYMLSKNHISDDDIEKSDKLLNEFADEFEDLYGEDAITMNLHILRHYAYVVKQGGPLWSQSMFSFESCIGYWLKSVISPVDEIEQIASNYCLKQNYVVNEANKYQRTAMRGAKRTELTYNLTQILIQHGISLNENKLPISNSVIWKGRAYNSLRNEKVKCADYFIETKNETIGCVEFYFNFENRIYLLLKKYETIDTRYHLNVVRSTNEHQVFEISEIKEQKLYLKYGFKEIVTVQPNFYEES